MTAVRAMLTGATGIIGWETGEVLRRRGIRTTAVSRRGRPDHGVLAWHIGSAPAPADVVAAGPFDVVIHVAGATRWTMTPAEAFAANVAPLLGLHALTGRDTHLVLVSTVRARGLESPERGLADYNNAYEWSKSIAEIVAHSLFDRVSVVRASLVIGRGDDGHAAKFTGVYDLVRAVCRGTAPALVAEPSALFDVVPVDAVATALVDAASVDGPAATAVVALGGYAPTTLQAWRQIIGAINEWRDQRGLPGIQMPPIVPVDQWYRAFLPLAIEHLSASQRRVVELLSVFDAYTSSTDPIDSTVEITDVLPALARAVTYWADRHPAVAAATPQAWRVR
ncbi:SDR family oxidoreductase [Actinosynnema sp. NPDC023587]|uniref:NAD-dependent epimerase/dehydratase family protein n=1 Tax=Actinosynnema sp. NPDC023587 TaxID=3154695 RepID=UPI0033F0D01A